MPKNTSLPDDCESPFGFWAVMLRQFGLSPIPTGGEVGKKPLIRNYNDGPPPSVASVARWSERFADANIGIVCGKSQVVVVDIDDPTLLEPMLSRFGDTPIIVKTGGGGYQLWYRETAPTRSRNLRKPENIAVEVKASGTIVIVPPSVNPQNGNAYDFHKGVWPDLFKLPDFHDGEARNDRNSSLGSTTALNPEGQRNIALFGSLMRSVADCASYDALLELGHAYNRTKQAKPQPDHEVEATAQSAWSYQQKGRNFLTKPAIVVPHESYDLFDRRGDSKAKALLLLILRHHGKRIQNGDDIFLAAEALAASQVMDGIRSPQTIKKCIDRLVELGFLLEQTSGLRVPRRFKFALPSVKNTDNVIDMPRPPQIQEKKKRQPIAAAETEFAFLPTHSLMHVEYGGCTEIGSQFVSISKTVAEHRVST